MYKRMLEDFLYENFSVDNGSLRWSWVEGADWSLFTKSDDFPEKDQKKLELDLIAILQEVTKRREVDKH